MLKQTNSWFQEEAGAGTTWKSYTGACHVIGQALQQRVKCGREKGIKNIDRALDKIDQDGHIMYDIWSHIKIHAAESKYMLVLLYLLDATGFYTPALHIMRLHVCRATGQELMDVSSRNARSRNREYERLRGPPWLQI
eukprot:Gb_06722 [translate_table: standard]